MNSQDFAPPLENPHGRKNPLQKLLALLAKIPQAFMALKNRFGKTLSSVGLGAVGAILGFFKKMLAVPISLISKILSPLTNLLPQGLRGIVKKIGILILAGIFLAGLGFGIKKIMTKPKPKETLTEVVADQKEGKEVLSAVKGFKVGRFNFEDSLNALGTLKGAIEFKLSFEVPGLVSSINYREGERYEEGALLMSLRQDDILLRLKRAQAALKKSETDVKLAQDKLEEH